MTLISDRKPDALLELGNRADLDVGVPSRLDKWYRDSYIELAMSVPFETLETSILGAFTPNVDIYPYPGNIRALRAPITMLDPDSGEGIQLSEVDIAIIRAETSPDNLGPPSEYCRFGRNIIIRPLPDQQYQFYWDAWLLPTITTVISATPLLVPLDWLEIVDMGAIMRGFRNLGERNKAQELQQLMFGYKNDTGKMVPGLITNRMTMNQAQSPARDYGLRPRVRTYTS